MTAAQIISADSHVQEPPELYDKWIPSKYRDKIPRVGERDLVQCLRDKGYAASTL